MKIGFIGAGNMAQAIITGIQKQAIVANQDLYVRASSSARTKQIAEQLNIQGADTNRQIAEQVDILIVAVKPVIVPKVLAEIAPACSTDKPPVIVSIAAGLSLNWLRHTLPTNERLEIIRVMPNMNATIGQSVSALCSNQTTREATLQHVTTIFSAVGTVYPIEEKNFANFTALAGCSPAFTYLYIDALARAGVKNGLSKELTTKIAAEAVLGSAKMVLESPESPWDLIDKVCSPGGTTIAGLVSLEDDRFMASVIRACEATIARDAALANE